MATDHSCSVLKMWTADPRVPIRFNKNSGSYSLIVNAQTSVLMIYCPACGERLNSGGPIRSFEGMCTHLSDLARKPKSVVRYRKELGEFWLFGRDGYMSRLHYCPICGKKLLLLKKDTRFHKKSPKELAQLTKRFQDISTIDLALEKFGPPDVQHGKTEEYIYPGGKRMRIGHKRALFYDRLAKTITPVVFELLDGRVEVKFYPKERKR